MNKEELQFTINRFDSYYESANNKGNFYIGYNIFVLGGLISLKKEFNELLKNDTTLTTLCLILTFLSCLSIVYILLSSLPFLKSGNNETYKSLYFFGSISKMTFREYKQNIESNNEEKTHNDLLNQSYQLSKGLNDKFQYLKYAGLSMLLQIAILMSIIFIIILKK